MPAGPWQALSAHPTYADDGNLTQPIVCGHSADEETRCWGPDSSHLVVTPAELVTVLAVIAFVVFRGVFRDDAPTPVRAVDYVTAVKAARADQQLLVGLAQLGLDPGQPARQALVLGARFRIQPPRWTGGR